MISAIVAIDDKRGIATDTGIPWDLPTDRTYFREKTTGAPILMGYNMYKEFSDPLPNRRNLVQIRPGTEPLKHGFEAVEDVTNLLKQYHDSPDTLWIVGGAKLYSKFMPVTENLYITHVQGDFHCTKFFPEYESDYMMVHEEPTQTENGLKFRFEVWHSNRA